MNVPVRTLAEPVDQDTRHPEIPDGDQATLGAGPRLRHGLHTRPNPQAQIGDRVDPERAGGRDGQIDQQQADAGETPLGTLALEVLPAGEALHLRRAVKEHDSSLGGCSPKAGGRC